VVIFFFLSIYTLPQDPEKARFFFNFFYFLFL
jgi:hypothetical protein